MNHSAALRLSESYGRRGLMRRIRIALGSEVRQLLKIAVLLLLLFWLTWNTWGSVLAVFLAGFVVGLFLELWAIDRHLRRQEVGVAERLEDPLRSYTVSDSGVAVRLSASGSRETAVDPEVGAADADLYATSIAWPLFASASRETDGWYLTIAGGGELFLPAAAVTEEVDAFIRERFAVTGPSLVGP